VKIYKYGIAIKDTFTISMPKGAQILSVQPKQREHYMWAMVDPKETEMESRRFIIIGTGWDVDISDMEITFIASLVQGDFVWHLFEWW